MRYPYWLIGSALLLTTSGCQSKIADHATTANTPSSGITGTAYIGPKCNTSVKKQSASCIDKPYQGAVQVTDTTTNVTTSVTSDQQGEFKITVPSGTYNIKIEAIKGKQPSEQTILVAPASWSIVNLYLNS